MKKLLLGLLTFGSISVFAGEECHIELAVTSDKALSNPLEEISNLKGTSGGFSSQTFERKIKVDDYYRTSFQKILGKNKFYKTETVYKIQYSDSEYCREVANLYLDANSSAVVEYKIVSFSNKIRK